MSSKLIPFPEKYRPKNAYFVDPEEVEQEDRVSSDGLEVEEIETETLHPDDFYDDAQALKDLGWGTDEDYGVPNDTYYPTGDCYDDYCD
jgi:hypothetical protein